METLSGPDIHKLANTTSPSGDIIQLVHSLLYNESKTDKLNINSNINFGHCDKVLVD